MNRYPHGCDHDYLQEMIDITMLHLHEIRECDGPPRCPYCLDAEKEIDEADKASQSNARKAV